VRKRSIPKVLRLAEVVDHLCQAQDELRAAGYEEWDHELGALIAAVDLEIGWLQIPLTGDQ
jgi:hypothetical protein